MHLEVLATLDAVVQLVGFVQALVGHFLLGPFARLVVYYLPVAFNLFRDAGEGLVQLDLLLALRRQFVSLASDGGGILILLCTFCLLKFFFPLLDPVV